MTELLHHTKTDRTGTSPAKADSAAVTVRRAPEVIAALDEDLTFQELAGLSIRHLRVLVNQAYTIMDTDCPPAGAKNRYDMIIEELEHRAQQASSRSLEPQLRETFRDNPLYCRFELIINGDLAAYVKYRMDGAQLVLIDGVEQPGFRDQDIDATLMRHIMLNAHKRRLNVLPQCLTALSFLMNYPEYRSLVNSLLT